MASAVAYLVGALIAYYLLSACYDLFLHPLAKIPGPLCCRISSVPSFYHACKGDRHLWILRNFELYGPKFRAGPNMVLFRSPEAHNDIYNHKANVRKSKFYDALARHKDDWNIVNSTDPAVHARKRRSMNLAFTEHSIKAATTSITTHVDRWNDICLSQPTDEEGWTAPKSMAAWAEVLVFDILGDLCFGVSFSTKEPGENPLKLIQPQIAETLQFVYAVSKSPCLDTLVWLKPRGLDKILDMISPKNMKDYHAFIERSVRRRISQDEKNIGSNTGPIREDMFHFICSARDPKTGQPVFTTADLISEGSVLTVAGSDTTATTICSLVFYLVHNTAIYDKLVTEIRSTFSSYQEIVHGPKLKGCAYLRACINEALRMTPPLPSELPRIVLKGGETIAGEYYPAGTIVGTSEWANGRNGDIYGDPYVFRPERWVISDENPRTEVNRIKNCLNPFSKGPANCIGQNLAMWELHLVIARTLWRLDIRAAPGATLGGGQPSVGLEKGNPLQYQVADAYVALRKGPMVQFKGRGGTLV